MRSLEAQRSFVVLDPAVAETGELTTLLPERGDDEDGIDGDQREQLQPKISLAKLDFVPGRRGVDVEDADAAGAYNDRNAGVEYASTATLALPQTDESDVETRMNNPWGQLPDDAAGNAGYTTEYTSEYTVPVEDLHPDVQQQQLRQAARAATGKDAAARAATDKDAAAAAAAAASNTNNPTMDSADHTAKAKKRELAETKPGEEGGTNGDSVSDYFDNLPMMASPFG